MTRCYEVGQVIKCQRSLWILNPCCEVHVSVPSNYGSTFHRFGAMDAESFCHRQRQSTDVAIRYWDRGPFIAGVIKMIRHLQKMIPRTECCVIFPETV